MRLDPRQTDPYRAVEAWYRRALEPSSGTISDATDLSPSPDGRWLAFTGTLFEDLDRKDVTRICMLDHRTGAVVVRTHGPNSDHTPRWAPDSARLAFLSDRSEAGIYQPYMLSLDRPGGTRLLVAVDGAAEYLEWSPDGALVLIGVAPRGADLAGAAGSGRIPQDSHGLPPWLPEVETGGEERFWRRLWVADPASGARRRLGPSRLNVWEATWCGTGLIAVVASSGPGEDGWYDAQLMVLDVGSEAVRTLYRAPSYGAVPQQLALPAAAPSGRMVAVVQGISSDRGAVTGNIRLVAVDTGAVTAVESLGVDVSHLAWRDEQTLVFAGLRDLDSVVGELHLDTGRTIELWSGPEFAGGPEWYPAAAPASNGRTYIVRERSQRPPTITCLRDGDEENLHVFSHSGTDFVLAHTGPMQQVAWRSGDGQEIRGLLSLPSGPGPHPLVVAVHGGPVGAWVDCWPMRLRGFELLVDHGYAVLYPNPRGGAGRGQAFVASLIGDMGGGDARDILSGIDALVERGVADQARIGVAGASYGGFMSAWLITQDQRLAAAVVTAPITDWQSFGHTSNIPSFAEIFLGASPSTREGTLPSPVRYADRVRTPTLTVVGALDRCTPPSQGEQFHRALLRHGRVESVLVAYPNVAHGPRRRPESIDSAARMLGWFSQHMPARSPDDHSQVGLAGQAPEQLLVDDRPD